MYIYILYIYIFIDLYIYLFICIYIYYIAGTSKSCKFFVILGAVLSCKTRLNFTKLLTPPRLVTRNLLWPPRVWQIVCDRRFWGCNFWHCVICATKQAYRSPKLPTLPAKKTNQCQKPTKTISNTRKSEKVVERHHWKWNVPCPGPTFGNNVAFKCKTWASPLHMLGNAMKSKKNWKAETPINFLNFDPAGYV